MEKFPLNLTDDERKAYEMLLAFGQLSAGELSQYGEFEFELTNEILKSLANKGYSSQVSNFGNKVIPKFPFLETHQHFQELTDKIHQIDWSRAIRVDSNNYTKYFENARKNSHRLNFCEMLLLASQRCILGIRQQG